MQQITLFSVSNLIFRPLNHKIMLLKYNFYISKGFKLKKHFVNFAIFPFFVATEKRTPNQPKTWVEICKLDFEALIYVQNMHTTRQNDDKCLPFMTVALDLAKKKSQRNLFWALNFRYISRKSKFSLQLAKNQTKSSWN